MFLLRRRERLTSTNSLTLPVRLMLYWHTHPFNGPLSGSTRVSRYQKGKTNLDFTGARDSEWQWHQLGDVQVCTLLQTDNHTSTSLLKLFAGRMPFLPPNQQCQSTEGIALMLQWRKVKLGRFWNGWLSLHVFIRRRWRIYIRSRCGKVLRTWSCFSRPLYPSRVPAVPPLSIWKVTSDWPCPVVQWRSLRQIRR